MCPTAEPNHHTGSPAGSTTPSASSPNRITGHPAAGSSPALVRSEPRIAIVGGSLSGPALALLLLHAGFTRLSVYEATPPRTTRHGGLISLEHSCLDVLDRLGIDQGELLASPSQAIVDIRLHGRRPATVAQVMYPGRLTTWTLLNRALTTRLPNQLLRAGARVTGLATRNGNPLLRFADGDAAAADLVVFADGRSSTGRRLLDPDRSLQFAGYVAHRGETSTPPPGFDHQDTFVRIDPGPGAQFALGPAPTGLDWVLFLDTTRHQFTDRYGTQPEHRPYVPPEHVPPAARTLVDANATRLLPDEHAHLVRTSPTPSVVPILDIDPPSRMVWPVGHGHAVLLGDALAPVRPHTARGANNGIEQAAGLAVALTQHHKHGADLAAALRGWQRRHLPGAIHWVNAGPRIAARLRLGQLLGTTARSALTRA